jgi:hypothetical protein
MAVDESTNPRYQRRKRMEVDARPCRGSAHSEELRCSVSNLSHLSRPKLVAVAVPDDRPCHLAIASSPAKTTAQTGATGTLTLTIVPPKGSHR